MNAAASGTISTAKAQSYVNRASSSGGISSSTASLYTAALSSGNLGGSSTKSSLGAASAAAALGATSLGAASAAAALGATSLGAASAATSSQSSLKGPNGSTIVSIQPVYIQGGGDGYSYRFTTADGKSHTVAVGGTITTAQLAKYFVDKAAAAAAEGDEAKAKEYAGSANEWALAAKYEEQSGILDKYGSKTGITYDATYTTMYDGDVDGTRGKSVFLGEGEKAPSGQTYLGPKTMTWKQGESFENAAYVDTLGEVSVSDLLGTASGRTNATEAAAQTKADSPAQSGIASWLINKVNYIANTASGVTGGKTPTNAGEAADAVGRTFNKISSDLGDKFIDWTENSLGVDDEGNLKVNDPVGLAAYVLTPATAFKVAKRSIEGRGDELEVLDYGQAALDVVGLIPGVGWAVKGVDALAKAGSKTALKIGAKTGEKALASTADDAANLVAKGAKATDVTSSASKLESEALKTSTLASNLNKISKVSTGVSLAGTAALIGYAYGDALTGTDASPDGGDNNGSNDIVEPTLPENPYAAQTPVIYAGGAGGDGYYDDGYYDDGYYDDGYYEEPEGGTGGSVAVTTAEDFVGTYGKYIAVALILIGLFVLFSKKTGTKSRRTA